MPKTQPSVLLRTLKGSRIGNAGTKGNGSWVVVKKGNWLKVYEKVTGPHDPFMYSKTKQHSFIARQDLMLFPEAETGGLWTGEHRGTLGKKQA